MRIKTFFLPLGEKKKKKETFELKLPQHGRSVKTYLEALERYGMRATGIVCNLLQDTQNHIGKAESSYCVG